MENDLLFSMEGGFSIFNVIICSKLWTSYHTILWLACSLIEHRQVSTFGKPSASTALDAGNAGGAFADPFAMSSPAPSSQPQLKSQAKQAPMAKQGSASNKPSTAKKDPFADLFS